jgi:hypothetical protein
VVSWVLRALRRWRRLRRRREVHAMLRISLAERLVLIANWIDGL